MIATPSNRLPRVGDTFCDSWNSQHVRIEAIGKEIIDGPYVGRMITDGVVWFDCFWSDHHQRFQYHTDRVNTDGCRECGR